MKQPASPAASQKGRSCFLLKYEVCPFKKYVPLNLKCVPLRGHLSDLICIPGSALLKDMCSSFFWVVLFHFPFIALRSESKDLIYFYRPCFQEWVHFSSIHLFIHTCNSHISSVCIILMLQTLNFTCVISATLRYFCNSRTLIITWVCVPASNLQWAMTSLFSNYQ